MQTVEDFATKVAGKVEGVDLPKVNPALIEMIMQFIMSMLQNCPNKANLTKSIKSPNRRQRASFRVQVKDTCDCCFAQKFRRDSGRIADATIDEAASLTDEQVASIVFDATNPDFVVI